MPFPFSFRPVLEGWKILFHRPEVYKADPNHDEEWNRGAYLVAGLGHCGACHTPRNAFGASEPSKTFGGASAEGWYVPPIGAASHSPSAGRRMPTSTISLMAGTSITVSLPVPWGR